MIIYFGLKSHRSAELTPKSAQQVVMCSWFYRQNHFVFTRNNLYFYAVQIQKTYKYKLRPNATQRKTFNRWLGSCRFVYNLCLEHRIHLWQSAGLTPSEYERKNELTLAKKLPGFEWLDEVHSQVLQDVVRRVRISFNHFFRGAGFPKWACKHSWHSFRYPQAHNGSIRIESSKIRLPKIGWVRFYHHRLCRGRIKQVTIKKW